MTVAIIDTAQTPFDIAARWYGCRLDTVNGKKHYVSVDRVGRAIVGPVAKRRRPNKKEKPVLVAHDDDQSGYAVPQPMRNVAEKLSLAFPPSPPPQKRGVFRRMADKLFDREWHHVVQHTALDVICWALAIGVVSFVAKALVWTWL
jgi:hypothetical protein